MAASRPTRSLLQEIRVIDVSNENVSGYFLLLEMAFQTEGRVAFIQQALVDGAVRRMTDAAPLLHSLMWVNPGTSLLCVTLEARFVSAEESETAGFEHLLNICRSAFGGDPFVRFMAIAAAHLAFRYRMMMGQCERCTDVQVTLETGVRRLPWIDDGASATAGFYVQTPGPVAGLAPHVLGVFTFRLQSRVGGCAEIAHDLLVAGRTFLRADELRARDAGRRQNCSVGRTAGKQNYS
jgi:hypothetical protein